MHIYRGRIADIFLDTPECNAHTTAADILWSGTPIITFPKYSFKMCSRVAASLCFATGCWPDRSSPHFNNDKLLAKKCEDKTLLGHSMVVNSYEEYLDRAVELGNSLIWKWVPLSSLTSSIPDSDSPYYPSREAPTYIYAPTGFANELRKQLFLNRESMPLFDTAKWTRDLENGIILALDKWKVDLKRFQEGERGGKRETRCIVVPRT